MCECDVFILYYKCLTVIMKANFEQQQSVDGCFPNSGKSSIKPLVYIIIHVVKQPPLGTSFTAWWLLCDLGYYIVYMVHIILFQFVFNLVVCLMLIPCVFQVDCVHTTMVFVSVTLLQESLQPVFFLSKPHNYSWEGFIKSMLVVELRV